MKNYFNFCKLKKIIIMSIIIFCVIVLFLYLRLKQILNIVICPINGMTYLGMLIKRVIVNFFSFSLIKFLAYLIIAIAIFDVFLILFFKKKILIKLKEKEDNLIDFFFKSNTIIKTIVTLTTITFFSTTICKVISENNEITLKLIVLDAFLLFIEITVIIFLYTVFIRLVHLEIFELINNSLIDCVYSHNDLKNYRVADKTLFMIFTIIILFILCLSIDKAFLVTKLNKEQYKFIKSIFENDGLFVLNKIIFRIGDDEKGMLFSAIIQLSSLFITFVGFIISFINQTIYSINIHMIICWKCNSFKMIYHRMATLVIFMLSFFILNSNYLLSIIFVDLYLIWIVIFNIYLVSSVCLHINFDSVIVEQMIKDTMIVKESLDYVLKKVKINRLKKFFDEYLYNYGKSIFLPMNLLNAHRKENKEEYYQLSCQCLSKYISFINNDCDNEIVDSYEKSIMFIMYKWIDDYFLIINEINNQNIDFSDESYFYKIMDLFNDIKNDFIKRGLISYFLFKVLLVLKYENFKEFINELSLENEELITSLIIYYVELYSLDSSQKVKAFNNGLDNLLVLINDVSLLFNYFFIISLCSKLSNSFENIYQNYSNDVNIILIKKGRKS